MSRANCNKIIMLFTDGGEERAQAILEKYNTDKKVTSRTRERRESHSEEPLASLSSVCCWFEGFLRDSAFQKLPLGFSICMRLRRTLKNLVRKQEGAVCV